MPIINALGPLGHSVVFVLFTYKIDAAEKRQKDAKNAPQP